MHAQKHKKHKNYKKRKDATKQKQRKHKKHKNANKKISHFFPLKCFLCAYKRCLFCFCLLICLLCYFVRVKSFCKKKKVSNCPNDLIYITTMESLTQYYLPSNVKILTSQEMQQRPGNGVFHCANTIT